MKEFDNVILVCHEEAQVDELPITSIPTKQDESFRIDILNDVIQDTFNLHSQTENLEVCIV